MSNWVWMVGAGSCVVVLACMPGTSPPRAQGAPATGVVRWVGTGSQVYACKREGDRFAWALQRPEATLTDAGGTLQGGHGAGPSWTALDGSTVFGAVVTVVPSPVPGAVPWLVLRASRHAGDGMMSDVGYVLRTDTEGGTVPISGCDPSRDGMEERRPYHATYTFLPETAAPRPAQPSR